MSRRRQNQRKELERKRKLRDQRRPSPRPAEHRVTELGEYTLFEHARQVFRVEFPTDWEWDEEEDKTIRFFPPGDVNVRVSVMAIMSGLDVDSMLDNPNMEKMFRAMFVQLRATDPRRDTTIPHYAWRADRNQAEVDGEYVLVASGDLLLSISAYYPEDQPHLWEPVIERMLSTFRIARQTEALLTRAISRLLRSLQERFPQDDYEFRPEDFELRGKNHALPLKNFAARIKNSPDRWEQLADEFLDTVATVMHSQELGVEQLEVVRDEIFPVIRSDRLVTGPGANTPQQLVRSEWLGDLLIAYWIRIPKGFRYITNFDLKRWSISRDELHDLAILNLGRTDARVVQPPIPAGTLPFVMVATGDNMESSRLLKQELYEQFAEMLGGPFIAAIPSRDALILFPNDEKLRRSMQDLVHQDHASSAYPITDRLFLVTPDGVTFAEW